MELEKLRRLSLPRSSPSVQQVPEEASTKKLEGEVQRLTRRLRDVETQYKKELGEMKESVSASQKDADVLQCQADKDRERASRMEAESKRLQHHIAELERSCHTKDEEVWLHTGNDKE